MGFYKNIYLINRKYYIYKDNESYGGFNTLPEALYERDKLIKCGWDWENYVEAPETLNNYIHMELPPFSHEAKFITHEKEKWMVYGKGRKYKYYGQYDSKEKANEIAEKYNGRLIHRKSRYRVQRHINGEPIIFGYFDNLEDAINKRNELILTGWEK